jgi:hypothetical protein
MELCDQEIQCPPTLCEVASLATEKGTSSMLETKYRIAEPKSANCQDFLGSNLPVSSLGLTPSPGFSEKGGLA